MKDDEHPYFSNVLTRFFGVDRIIAVVTLVVTILSILSLIIGLKKDLEIVLGEWFSAYLVGFWTTFGVSIFSIVFGTLIGMAIAFIQYIEEPNKFAKLIRSITSVYLYAFLAIPVYVLIIYLHLSSMINFVNAISIAIFALSINLSPFAAKIILTGLRTISKDQMNAAKTAGLNDWQRLRYVTAPLMRELIGEPLLVQWYTTIKLSSLASAIGVTEIFHTTQRVVMDSYKVEAAFLILVLVYITIIAPFIFIAEKLHNDSRMKGS